MKPIHYSDHARLQMSLRGATEEEVAIAIKAGKWEAGKLGRLRTRYQFNFNKVSLTNQKYYKFKTVEPIFVDEINELVVITVKVYYSNEEVKL